MVVEASVFNVPKSYIMTVMMVDMHLMVVHMQTKFKDSSNTLFRPRDHLLLLSSIWNETMDAAVKFLHFSGNCLQMLERN